MGETAPPSAEQVNRYVAGVGAVAVVAVVSAVYLLARDTAIGGPLAIVPLDVVWGAGVAVAFAVLHRYPFTFHWREHRLVVSLDEAGILLGLLIVPAPMLTLSIVYANVFMQWWGGPKQTIKRVFNVAQYATAAGITASLYLLITLLGVPPLPSAILASLTFGVVANLLLAGVFSRLSGESMLAIYRERFALQGFNSSLISIAGGIALYALWQVHPLATLSILPFAYLVRGYWRLHANADRELDVHRQLANAMHELVGSSSVPAVAERVVTECERILDAGRVEINVLSEHHAARTFGSGPQARAEPMRESLPGRDGGSLGEIAVWARQGKEAYGDQERALLRTIAGQAASAIENARAIAEVDAARDRLETYLSTAQDAVVLVDAEGWIRYLNPAAKHLLGVPDERRLRAADFFDDTRLARADGALPEKPELIEAEGHTLDHLRYFDVEAHVGPVRESGRVTGTLMVVRDVTERKRLEDEMARQREALAQSDKLSTLGTLVAGVAHEINNPLTFMRGNLQLCRDALKIRLRREDLTPEERRFAEDLREEVDVALEGVDRIHDIAASLKNVAKRGSGDRRPEDLNGVIREVIQVVRTGLPRSVRLDLELSPDLPPVVARSSELHQVILNLVKNAVEALEGKTDARVCVRSRTQDGRVMIDVEDNGAGIPPDVQKSLFQAFFTTKPKGTGLGLSISRGIVQSHGGEMLLRSEPGVGTRFTIDLPAAERAPTTS